MAEAPRYWFHAKRYGWGWGAPATWQGWAVLVAYLMLTFAGLYVFPPITKSYAYFAWIGFLSLIVLAICVTKGAPRRWRWGDPD